MSKTLLGCIAAALALSGCAVRYSSQANSGGGVQTTTAGAQVNVSTASPVGAAIIVGVMAADAVNYYRIGPDGKTPVYGAPEPDPTRKINVQDCTKPIDWEAGNLLCR